MGLSQPTPEEEDQKKNARDNWSKDSSSVEEPEDVAKWERMYYNRGASNNALNNDSPPSSPSSSSSSISQIKVITFDLDNTLWKTSPVISFANDALASHLASQNLTHPDGLRVEQIMNDLFRSNRDKYTPSTSSGGPVQLTRLRKDALRSVYTHHNRPPTTSLTRAVDESFTVWTRARHEAIPRHLATNVTSTLHRIRTLRSWPEGAAVIVGAVTDGNSDPRVVDLFATVFDFVVNAEGVGVAKPHRRVYWRAWEEVQRVMRERGDELGGVVATEESMDDFMGPWWVHVGDDFMKDVAAAKDLKMRSVWSRELVLPPPSLADENDTRPKKTVGEFVKEISQMKRIDMAIGADDFLANGVVNEFADAIVDRFEELADVLIGWHEEGVSLLQSEELTSSSAEETLSSPAVVNGDGGVVSSAVTDLFDSIDGVSPVPGSQGDVVEASSLVDGKVTGAAAAVKDVKFCVYCGTKLIKVAKFCSECGEKQPELFN